MIDITTVVDALNDMIVIGDVYGYSTASGGWARTVIGEAVGITQTGRVSLRVIRHQTFLYGEKTDYNPGGDKVNIRSHMLFPIRGAQ